MIAAIQECWPNWDWTVPGHRVPDAWTERILKPLRYIARRIKEPDLILVALDAAIKDRVENRAGRRGASKEDILTATDVRSVLDRMIDKDNPDRSLVKLDLANRTNLELEPSPPPSPWPEPEQEQEPESEPDIEVGRRGQEPLLLDRSSEHGGAANDEETAGDAGAGNDQTGDQPTRRPRRPRSPKKHDPIRAAEHFATILQKEVELREEKLRKATPPEQASPTFAQDLQQVTRLWQDVQAAKKDRDDFATYFSSSAFASH
ncbi:hypothetical protein AC578_5904 [Pseudocercospora eumusae]|uniref:Uncharacterized protein n=1 Tax=Pseudocercospora eumusae TaxID=321146 RepID=A0A139HBG8_9PEZI|nr:hypothetical protein AC578_5904 [Pseudocercospora eumusae]